MSARKKKTRRKTASRAKSKAAAKKAAAEVFDPELRGRIEKCAMLIYSPEDTASRCGMTIDEFEKLLVDQPVYAAAWAEGRRAVEESLHGALLARAVQKQSLPAIRLALEMAAVNPAGPRPAELPADGPVTASQKFRSLMQSMGGEA